VPHVQSGTRLHNTLRFCAVLADIGACCVYGPAARPQAVNVASVERLPLPQAKEQLLNSLMDPASVSGMPGDSGRMSRDDGGRQSAIDVRASALIVLSWMIRRLIYRVDLKRVCVKRPCCDSGLRPAVVQHLLHRCPHGASYSPVCSNCVS